MWESENEFIRRRDYYNGVLNSNKHDVETDGFLLKGHSWYVSSEIPSDILVQVGDICFHLHKFPLISYSGKLNRFIHKSRNPDIDKVELDDLPGGSEAFELASKFCYGIPIDLTASNASSLRCAAEYLEMTEDLEEGNLIFKTEAFISYVVLSSWKDSITIIKSCENLSPWAEDLQIVRRCSDSIAWKACANPKLIKWAYSNSTTSGDTISQDFVPQDWWFEDVATLRIDHFVKIITAIKVKGMHVELIGSSIVHYATEWLSGLLQESSSSIMFNEPINIRTTSTSTSTTNNKSKVDQKTIVECLISILPPKTNSISCAFLLRLLTMANMFKVAQALTNELEKRIGMQFEQATVADLLIPLFGSSKNEGLYDIDLVQRLVEHFLVQEQTENLSPAGSSKPNSLKNMLDDQHDNHDGGLRSKARIKVAKIVDSYLSEISKDRNLSLIKFQVLAEALPQSARNCDDGLYRAIDSYLKAHPMLSEHERKRLCRVLDCQKLSIDACMHAAQNERLPLRIVVQVLFSKQVKISNAIANNTTINNQSQHQPKSLLEGAPQSFQEDWSTAINDISKLKFDIETVKTKYIELQNEMENLHRQFEKVNEQKSASGWSHGWKKLSTFPKIGHLESHGEAQNGEIPTRKGPRKWRNSIS